MPAVEDLADQAEPGRFRTDRLRCRLLEPGDEGSLFDLDQDPEVMRYLTGGRPGTRAEAEQRVARAGAWTWLATSTSDGFVGWFSLRPTGAGERELGYRLRRECWGLGYATEGSARCVELAFTTLGAERVWAQTMTVNVGSRRVMEKLGLSHCRTFYGDWDEPIPGADDGDVEYELTRADWESGRQAPGSVPVD